MKHHRLFVSSIHPVSNLDPPDSWSDALPLSQRTVVDAWGAWSLCPWRWDVENSGPESTGMVSQGLIESSAELLASLPTTAANISTTIKGSGIKRQCWLKKLFYDAVEYFLHVIHTAEVLLNRTMNLACLTRQAIPLKFQHAFASFARDTPSFPGPFAAQSSRLSPEGLFQLVHISLHDDRRSTFSTFAVPMVGRI
jgi:hypothetical protein